MQVDRRARLSRDSGLLLKPYRVTSESAEWKTTTARHLNARTAPSSPSKCEEIVAPRHADGSAWQRDALVPLGPQQRVQRAVLRREGDRETRTPDRLGKDVGQGN